MEINIKKFNFINIMLIVLFLSLGILGILIYNKLNNIEKAINNIGAMTKVSYPILDENLFKYIDVELRIGPIDKAKIILGENSKNLKDYKK